MKYLRLALLIISLYLPVDSFTRGLLGSKKWGARPLLSTNGYDNFDQFLSSMDVPVLVDFYAEWYDGWSRLLRLILGI
jgi:hypothetical protein